MTHLQNYPNYPSLLIPCHSTPFHPKGQTDEHLRPPLHPICSFDLALHRVQRGGKGQDPEANLDEETHPGPGGEITWLEELITLNRVPVPKHINKLVKIQDYHTLLFMPHFVPSHRNPFTCRMQNIDASV